jgi:hypothetical protein
MKPIVVAVALASALLMLRAVAASPGADTDCVEPVLVAGLAAAGPFAPESPAAAFARMLAPRAPVTAPAPVGAPADALTRAFNAVLWSAPIPAMNDASAQIPRVASAE